MASGNAALKTGMTLSWKSLHALTTLSAEHNSTCHSQIQVCDPETLPPSVG